MALATPLVSEFTARVLAISAYYVILAAGWPARFRHLAASARRQIALAGALYPPAA